MSGPRLPGKICVPVILAALSMLPVAGCRGDIGSRTPDVILLSLDTLRRDAVGAYGQAPSLTPNLDELAHDAVVFESATVPMPYTLPSHMSLFTGLYPTSHAVTELDHRLSVEIPTLGELVAATGYQAVGIVTNGYLLPDFGFGRGFHSYEFLPHRLTYADRVNAAALEALDHARAGQPLFLFLHYQDVHSDAEHIEGNCFPYYAPPEFRDSLGLPEEAFRDSENRCATALLLGADRDGRPLDPPLAAATRALYRSGVRYLDHELGTLFEELRGRGRYDGALIIVTSDHGEELGDHGRIIHAQPFEECVGVPLIMKFPAARFAGRRISETVEIVDVLPTVAESLGIHLPHQIHGESLLPLLEGQARRKTTALSQDKQRRSRFALRRGRYKILREEPVDEVLLFDLETDPGERRDIAGQRPDVVKALTTELERLLESAEVMRRDIAPGAPPPRPGPLGVDERRHLKALGYVHDEPSSPAS